MFQDIILLEHIPQHSDIIIRYPLYRRQIFGIDCLTLESVFR